MEASRGFRGVQNDLSELGRHLLDIACFLSPIFATVPPHNDSPPPTPPLFPSPHSHPNRLRLRRRRRRRSSPSPRPPSARILAGILSDLAEFGGGLRSGLSRLSAVVLGPLPEEEEDDDEENPAVDDRRRRHHQHQYRHRLSVDSRADEVVGVPEDLRDFVCNLVKCPELWLEFPVTVSDDFHMSHFQREHVETMECLVPELAELRFSLCPSQMSEGSFWRIYFALLHPRLSIRDSEKLSTQQILDSMRLALKGMQNRLPARSQSFGSHSSLPVTSDNEQEKNQAWSYLMTRRTGSQQSIGQFSEVSSIGMADIAWPNFKSNRRESQQSFGQFSEVPDIADSTSNLITSRIASSTGEFSEVPSRTGSEQSIGQFFEVPSITDAAQLNHMKTRTDSEQSIGQFSEVPSTADFSSEGTTQLRNLSASFSGVDAGSVMVEKYIDSLLTDTARSSMHASVGSRRNIARSASDDWHPVEDSDFEMVDRA